MSKAKLITILLAGAISTSYSQEDSYEAYSEADDKKDRELYMALGYVRSFDSNLFNNKEVIDVGNSLGIQLAYLIPASESFYIGPDLTGYFSTVSKIGVNTHAGYFQESLELNAFNIGIQTRWMLLKHDVVNPYVQANLNYSFGTLLINNIGVLNNYSGYTIGSGAGVRFSLNNGVALGIEASGNIGSATWQYELSSDASSQRFNPGQFSLMAGICFFIAPDQYNYTY